MHQEPLVPIASETSNLSAIGQKPKVHVIIATGRPVLSLQAQAPETLWRDVRHPNRTHIDCPFCLFPSALRDRARPDATGAHGVFQRSLRGSAAFLFWFSNF